MLAETDPTVVGSTYGPSQDGGGLVAGESQWSDALCDWFFRPDLAGQPVYLACDLSTPAAVALAQGWQLPDPLGDLVSAVRGRVGASEPLDPWVRQASRWRSAGSVGNPPWVAALAVTVLAAAGGGRSGDGLVLHERGYYRPLRQLLGLPDGAQPRSFDNDVCMLWTFLRQWLEDDLAGSRGRATARAPRHLPHVGWALSQTLLNAGERARLPDFFRAVGALPGEDIGAGALLACYLRWAPRHHRQAGRLVGLDRASAAAGVLAEVLHQALLAWDGRSRDERGRTTLPLLLAYHHSRGALQLASRVPAALAHRQLDVDGQLLTLGASQEYLLLPGDPAGALVGMAVVGRLLPEGDSPAEAAVDLQMRLPVADLHVLAPSVELGMWAEVAGASFGQQHVVLVRDQVAPAVEQAITDLGGSPTRLTRIRLPLGWRAYQQFEPARVAEVPASLMALLPRGGQLVHLSGGLPLDQRARVWLTGGPPDVELPGLPDAQERLLRLDGIELPWPAGGRLRLRGYQLAAGPHELVVAGRVLRFVLADEAVDQDGRGDVRLTVDRRPIHHTLVPEAPPHQAPTCGGVDAPSAGQAGSPLTEVLVCGASMRAGPGEGRLPALPPRRHVRVGGCYYVLGRPGQAARLHPVAPAWLAELDPPLYARDADLATALAGVDFPPRWLLHVPARGLRTVVSVGQVLPSVGPRAAEPPATGQVVWRSAAEGLDLVQPPAGQEAAWQAWLEQDCEPRPADQPVPPSAARR